jgi:hypothetical protein
MVVLIFSVVFIANLSAQSNILINGDIETIEPGFWHKLNGTTECIWATDTAAATFNSRRSFKIVKSAASSDVIGWRSDNNADKLWNNAGDGAYKFSFSAKTEGVNTSPANADATISVRYSFYDASDVLLGVYLLPVDQTTASTSWTEYSGVGFLSQAPDQVYAELIMGKDATGTVWFDNIGCNTDPGWSMGIFGGNAETPVGWTNWASSGEIGFANFVADTGAHSGDYSVLLEEKDNNADEMVFNGYPVPAESGKWYKIGVWVKTDSINTDTDSSSWWPTNSITARDNNRIGITYFFHKAPIETSWDLLSPGDYFFYIDQRGGQEKQGWTQYNVIAQAPAADVGGVSMRARFTSYPTGRAWYDDFSIEPVTMVITSLEEPSNYTTLTPSDFQLENNYPNPFNPETIIEYKVPKTGQVKLAIFNVLGQKVKTLVDAHQLAGIYNVMWDGKDESGNKLATGVYFYQLIGENALITKKMTLLK